MKWTPNKFQFILMSKSNKFDFVWNFILSTFPTSFWFLSKSRPNCDLSLFFSFSMPSRLRWSERERQRYRETEKMETDPEILDWRHEIEWFSIGCREIFIFGRLVFLFIHFILFHGDRPKKFAISNHLRLNSSIFHAVIILLSKIKLSVFRFRSIDCFNNVG